MYLIPFLPLPFVFAVVLVKSFLAELLLANKLSESNVISNFVLPFSGGERPQTALITGYDFLCSSVV